MQISQRVVGSCEDAIILDISGEIMGEARLDLSKAIQKALETEEIKGIILNLKDVPIVDSVALAGITTCYTQAWRKGIKLVLLAPNRSVCHLLVITKMDNTFEKYWTEEEAIYAVQGRA